METFYDAFAGMGGIRLGMENAGFVCIGSCEIDKNARKTYAKNFNHEPIHSDIRCIETLPKDTSILCGGFPCQSFSMMGKREGFKSSNGNLFFELARLLDALRPKAFLFENVKGLLSQDGGRTFKIIKETLAKLGYLTFDSLLNSKDFGLPQKRERVFIVGFSDSKSAKKFNFPRGKSKEVKLSTIIEKGVNESFEVPKSVLDCYLYKLKTKHKGGCFLPSLQQLDEVGNTLTTDGNRILVFEDRKIRYLTPREWARIQGFPDTFQLSETKTQAYKQIGNSVPVPVITAIGKNIAKALKGRKHG